MKARFDLDLLQKRVDKFLVQEKDDELVGLGIDERILAHGVRDVVHCLAEVEDAPWLAVCGAEEVFEELALVDEESKGARGVDVLLAMLKELERAEQGKMSVRRKPRPLKALDERTSEIASMQGVGNSLEKNWRLCASKVPMWVASVRNCFYWRLRIVRLAWPMCCRSAARSATS
jgi:hypothetical protein